MACEQEKATLDAANTQYANDVADEDAAAEAVKNAEQALATSNANHAEATTKADNSFTAAVDAYEAYLTCVRTDDDPTDPVPASLRLTRVRCVKS